LGRRFFAHPLVRMFAITTLFVAVVAAAAVVLNRWHAPWTMVLAAWALLAILAAIVFGAERLLPRGPSRVGLDLRSAPRGLLTGLGIGAVLFSAVILELTAAGDYRIVGAGLSGWLVQFDLLLVASAATEELFVRGVVFRLLSEWAGTWIALAVSAAIFGALHAFNHGATWISSTAIALEAGVLLAAAYVAAGNLWVPIGLHIAWNFCEGPLYGTTISGGSVAHTIFRAHLTGPSLLTGGAFGPEAGLPAVLTCLVAAAVLLAYARAKNRIVPCPWLPRRALQQTTSG
jgi:membrane protease YdiL (CAAX protease family)